MISATRNGEGYGLCVMRSILQFTRDVLSERSHFPVVWHIPVKAMEGVMND